VRRLPPGADRKTEAGLAWRTGGSAQRVLTAMKFAYVDESGDGNQSDVFVMVGCLVDAYSLRRITAEFDKMLKDLREKHPGQPTELKFKRFINGDGGWRVVPPAERKDFVRSICRLAAKDGTLFASALSFERFRGSVDGKQNHPAATYWHAASMFVTSLIQKKMQTVAKNKGHTVLVMDDNKIGMAALSDAIYSAEPWFDGLSGRRAARTASRCEGAEAHAPFQNPAVVSDPQ
jgi:Protein of unknown function (DUF3800)